MTIRRDPTSAAGAWWETGQALGWGTLAEECCEKERTIRSWADPGKEPPVRAMECADKLLKTAGHPPYNTIALGARISDGKRDPLNHLVDAVHRVDMAVLLFESSRLEGWRPNAAMRECNQIIQRVSQLVRIILDHVEHAAVERPERPPRLRAVVGGEE